MILSANICGPSNGRTAKRRATAHRITTCAQRLTRDRGLDGFTMDELAEEAGVSRRTLFNYFPGKDDAVLGQAPALGVDVLEAFAAGQPTGNLIDDLTALILEVLDNQPHLTEDVQLGREVMLANPRLITLAQQRFERIVTEFMAYAETREGPAFDARRIRTALAVVMAVFHVCLESYLEDTDSHDLTELFTDSMRTTRKLFT